MNKLANQREHYAPQIPNDVQKQQREKMEKSEGQLHDYEARSRLYNQAVNAARVEPAKGWVDRD